MKTAVITGITGQDGSFLAELLLEKGYKVYGVVRRVSTTNLQRIKHLLSNENLIISYGDITDMGSIYRIINEAKPDEFYNLAAQSFVQTSFTNPILTANSTALGVLNCLEAIRIFENNTGKKVKFYQAGSSEQFGKAVEFPQTEKTPFYPRSPYAVSKVFGYWITKNYRESYNMFALTGILFNHESERRGIEFVTRKITHTIARIANGEDIVLELGNLDAKRDWGYAKDYVRAMWLMLQQDEPKEYVIATGEQHSVREFAELACKFAGLNIHWEGEGINERAVDENGRVIIKVSPKYFRPAEVNSLLGDYSLAKKELGWEPKVKFKELVKIMIEYDLKNTRHRE